MIRAFVEDSARVEDCGFDTDGHPYHRLWVSSHPRRHAHRSQLVIATRCRWCGATAANHAEHLNHNPQPWPSLLQMPKSWGNNMFKCCSAAFTCYFFNSLVDDLPIWFMQKRQDSCDLYFWEVADVGECNFADYLVSRGIPILAGWGVGQVIEGTTEEEDAEQSRRLKMQFP